jgi:hypothetical protein
VSPNDVTDTDQVRHRLAAFENRYNPIAAPFGGRFTRHEPPTDDHCLAA